MYRILMEFSCPQPSKACIFQTCNFGLSEHITCSLPKPIYLKANRNDFQQVSYPFLGMSETVRIIDIRSAKMRSADGVESMSGLTGFWIDGNDLETVPDLLGLKKLDVLLIADNSRMKCDQRMCWRRLWERMRAPLVEEDDVICVEPLLHAKKTLSSVNLKFMQCDYGKISSHSVIYYHDKVSEIAAPAIVGRRGGMWVWAGEGWG